MLPMAKACIALMVACVLSDVPCIACKAARVLSDKIESTVPIDSIAACIVAPIVEGYDQGALTTFGFRSIAFLATRPRAAFSAFTSSCGDL